MNRMRRYLIAFYNHLEAIVDVKLFRMYTMYLEYLISLLSVNALTAVGISILFQNDYSIISSAN